jgi:hypothetical protein
MPCPRTPIFTRAPRVLAACALAGTLALGLTACGSSGSSAAASSAGTSTTSSSSRYQARLKAAECLRAHGLSVPDPSPNAGGGAGGGAAGGGAAGGGAAGGGAGGGGGAGRVLRQALATTAGRAAAKACASDISKAFAFANTTPAQLAQRQQALVKFAQCMRAHNVNIPDPTSGVPGGFGFLRSITPSERQSPVFQTAFKTCSSTLPNRGRFGGGAGGAGAVGGPGA